MLHDGGEEAWGLVLHGVVQGAATQLVDFVGREAAGAAALVASASAASAAAADVGAGGLVLEVMLLLLLGSTATLLGVHGDGGGSCDDTRGCRVAKFYSIQVLVSTIFLKVVASISLLC